MDKWALLFKYISFTFYYDLLIRIASFYVKTIVLYIKHCLKGHNADEKCANLTAVIIISTEIFDTAQDLRFAASEANKQTLKLTKIALIFFSPTTTNLSKIGDNSAKKSFINSYHSFLPVHRSDDIAVM